MSREPVICPNCAASCDPVEGVACRACGAFLGAAPLVGSAREIGPLNGAKPTAGPMATAGRHRWPWRRSPGDDLLPDAERRRRRRRRIGGGLMIAVSLGTTAWWRSLDEDGTAPPSAVVGDGAPQLGDGGAGIDRPQGRPLRAGGEMVLAEVYRPAAELHDDWGTWTQVTPAAIGESLDAIGLLGDDVSPERADEVSMDVSARGLMLGALDLDLTDADCVWLRDRGLGAEIVHGTGGGNCAASEAPSRGWESVEA